MSDLCRLVRVLAPWGVKLGESSQVTPTVICPPASSGFEKQQEMPPLTQVAHAYLHAVSWYKCSIKVVE